MSQTHHSGRSQATDQVEGVTPEPSASTPAQGGRTRPSYLRALRRDPLALAGAVTLTVAIVAATVGPMVAGERAVAPQLQQALVAPFAELGWEILGTDQLGRPMLARLLAGTRTSLLVALPAVGLAAIFGGAIGMSAGLRGGRVEVVVLRAADIIMSFPGLLLALVVLFVFSPSVGAIVLLLIVARLPIHLRTARAETARMKARPYMEASQTFGSSQRWQLFRHVRPIVVPTLLTVAALDLSTVILIEAALSFLGVGIQPPTVSLGGMVAAGRDFMQQAWWLTVLPGAAIVALTVSANFLSSWLRLVTTPGQRWRLEQPV